MLYQYYTIYAIEERRARGIFIYRKSRTSRASKLEGLHSSPQTHTHTTTERFAAAVTAAAAAAVQLLAGDRGGGAAALLSMAVGASRVSERAEQLRTSTVVDAYVEDIVHQLLGKGKCFHSLPLV